MEENINQKFQPFFFLVLTLFAFGSSCLYYFIDFYPSVINFNEFWLYTCSERILGGEKMSVGCFDSNPPLSVLLYTPSVLITRYLFVPVHISLFVYSLMALCLSTSAIYLTLKKSAIANNFQIAVFLYAYFISNLFLSGLFLGERDHFVLFALVPFILIQTSITQKTYSYNLGSFFLMMICLFFLLIKPHYGLIPAIFILHRIKIQKAGLSDIFQWKDVQAAFLAIVLYAICIVIFFPDFISEILMTSIKFYVISHREFPLYELFAQLLIINLIMIGTLLIYKNKLRINHLLIILAVISFLSLFPFLLQFKGTPYQAIPPKILLFCFSTLIFYQMLELKFSKYISASLSCFLIMIFCLLFKPINTQTPTHIIYEEFPLTKIIKENAPPQKQCDFFIFEGMKAVQILSYYSNCNLSSRFPVLWFFPTLLTEEEKFLQGEKSILTQEEFVAYKKKFATIILDDLKKNPPSSIILGENFVFSENGEFFSFETFMTNYEPNFKNFWQNYSFQKRTELFFPDIMEGTTFISPKTTQTYAIYVRNN